MKFVVSIFATSLLLTACSKTQSDAEIRQKIPGTWIPDWNPDFSWKMEQTPNGSYFSKLYRGPQGWTAEGTWKIDHGMMVLAVTNASFPPNTMPPVEKYRVVHIADHEMKLLRVGADKYQTVHKR